VVRGPWSGRRHTPKLSRTTPIVTDPEGALSDLTPPRGTERRNPRSLDIDELAVGPLVDLFLREDATVAVAVAGARDAIVEATGS
jgi:hypothetical protein